jgi:endonuclease/exonuclease/phosphatase family metal-dependent hydrolase
VGPADRERLPIPAPGVPIFPTGPGQTGAVSSAPRVARLAGLVVLVYALLRLPAGADTPPGTLSVLQFNMCGNACETRFMVVDDLEAEITGRGRQPFVVTLNEVCRGQYDRLLAKLANLPYHGNFQTTVPNRCWDGSDYGIAVLVRSSDVEHAGSAPLPAPAGGEPRTVTCVRTAVRERALVACVTHLDTDPANTTSQVAAVAEHAAAFTADAAVVVGGDFNTIPGRPALDPMDAGFVEADAADDAFTGGCSRARCGGGPGYAHPTRKIDYVFLSRGDFTGVSASVTSAPHSDHTPLWATATLAPAR